MILSEYKERVRDRAFEDNSQMTEYVTNFINASNMALTELHTFDEQRLSTFTVDGGTHNPSDIKSDYSKIKEAYIGTEKFNDYIMPTDYILIIPEHLKDVTFVYERKVQEITKETPDDAKIDVAYDLESMLILLTSFYLWIDAEEEKAYTYYDIYRQRRDDYMESKEKAPAKGTFIDIGETTWL